MQTLKTYIVEDSAVICQSLIATLEELAPVVVVGTAGEELEAVTWLAEPGHQVDLVIVDIFLKSGSGLGVLRAAQVADNEMPHPLTQRKLVVLSNYATQGMRSKCLELGADRVFDKSNDIDALLLYCQQLAQGEVGNTALGLL
jgi:DNA-binding NarL/FixJ family response regulator